MANSRRIMQPNTFLPVGRHLRTQISYICDHTSPHRITNDICDHTSPYEDASIDCIDTACAIDVFKESMQAFDITGLEMPPYLKERLKRKPSEEKDASDVALEDMFEIKWDRQELMAENKRILSQVSKWYSDELHF
eukprot:24652_1